MMARALRVLRRNGYCSTPLDYLEPQPDDDLPRFAYEEHLARLTADDRSWPEGTRRISQLRLTLEYEPHGLIARNFGSGPHM